MEFPDDILHLIRLYAKPIGTRVDWRTCKRNESILIFRHNILNLQLCEHYFRYTQTMFREILDWTLYGRKHTLRNLLRWPYVWLPVVEDDWYEHRFMNYDWQTDEMETQASHSLVLNH